MAKQVFFQSSLWGLKVCQTQPFCEAEVLVHGCVPGAARTTWRLPSVLMLCCQPSRGDISIPAIGLPGAPLMS